MDGVVFTGNSFTSSSNLSLTFGTPLSLTIHEQPAVRYEADDDGGRREVLRDGVWVPVDARVA